ncbi:MAG: ABC transporter ATP-binding protein, partial [Gammaproteobacteria bacterium]
MLSFTDVACRRDGKLLFHNADFVIHRGRRVGLGGANGAGKSSLLAMILGELEPDEGVISLQQQVGMTHVAQEMPTGDAVAIEHVMAGDQRIAAIAAAISESEASGDNERYANLLADYEAHGGYSLKSRAASIMLGLGFSMSELERPLSSFSGGWQMRLNLARALVSPNELLLLDEPTNHLDLDAVIWLEQWLLQREGTLLLISHDREFLDTVVHSMLFIEKGTVHLVSGNYSALEAWRAARDANQQALHEKAEKRRAELQSFVDRFRAKATKARQAQSRLKMLERMGETSAVRVESPFRFGFATPEHLPNPLLVLDSIRAGYDDKVVLDKVACSIGSG